MQSYFLHLPVRCMHAVPASSRCLTAHASMAQEVERLVEMSRGEAEQHTRALQVSLCCSE